MVTLCVSVQCFLLVNITKLFPFPEWLHLKQHYKGLTFSIIVCTSPIIGVCCAVVHQQQQRCTNQWDHRLGSVWWWLIPHREGFGMVEGQPLQAHQWRQSLALEAQPLLHFGWAVGWAVLGSGWEQMVKLFAPSACFLHLPCAALLVYAHLSHTCSWPV